MTTTVPTGLLPAALLSLFSASTIAQQAGDLDTSFGVAGKVTTDLSGSNDEGNAVALQPDGKIIVTGSVSDATTGRASFGLARYLPDGSLDPTFGGDGLVTTGFGSVHAIAQAIVLQPDGKIVVGGYTIGDFPAFALARYLPDGSLDPSFSADGKLTTDLGTQVDDLVLQPDGKIVAVGNIFVARYLADGALDMTFGDQGVAATDFEQRAVALQSDGKIVTAGAFFNTTTFEREFALTRYLPTGAVDTTFGVNGRVNTRMGIQAQAASVALQRDGAIVAAGSFFNATTVHMDFALARYLPNGTLDVTFSGDGLVTTDFGSASESFAMILQRDGKIVAAGYALSPVFALARYQTNGALDTTFSGNGLVTTDFGAGDPVLFSSIARGLAMQPDGRIVAAGLATVTGEGGFDFALARYETGLSPEFGPPASVDECKQEGWRAFNIPRVFKGQGDCVQFVLTGK